MSERLRMSGLVSGMDTETIVSALVSAASYKTTKLKNTQTKLGWKQDIWKSLNSEVYSLYSSKLDNLRYEGNYNAKKATVNNDIATITADNNAVLGAQSLVVRQMAASGYLTGDKVKVFGSDKAPAASDTFFDIVDKSAGSSDFTSEQLEQGITIKVKVGTDTKDVTITANDTMEGIAEKFSKIGLTANYDANNGRFFIASKTSGEAANFEIDYENNSPEAKKAIERLGLMYTENNASSGAVKIKGQDAEITLNGAAFKSSSNTFAVNGLNITVKGISEKDADDKFKASTITTSVDVDTIYNSIKDFFKTYNDLIKKMDGYYNADAAKGYDVLSEKEKEAMSDDEVKQWEDKIKDSLLRKDDNLNSLINLFKNSLSKSYDVNGKQYSLASFGIATLGYFEAKDNEHGMYHIDGDQDDDSSKSKDDVLKKMIASDPEAVSGFFTQLFKATYKELSSSMRSIEGTRSAMKVYDDKALQKEYDNLTNDISDQEKKVQDLEDFYYDKFTAMEKALSKLNTQSGSFSALIGN